MEKAQRRHVETTHKRHRPQAQHGHRNKRCNTKRETPAPQATHRWEQPNVRHQIREDHHAHYTHTTPHQRSNTSRAPMRQWEAFRPLKAPHHHVETLSPPLRVGGNHHLMHHRKTQSTIFKAGGPKANRAVATNSGPNATAHTRNV